MKDALDRLTRLYAGEPYDSVYGTALSGSKGHPVPDCDAVLRKLLDATPVDHASLEALGLPVVMWRGFVLSHYISLFKSTRRGWVLACCNPSGDFADSFEIGTASTIGQLRLLALALGIELTERKTGA